MEALYQLSYSPEEFMIIAARVEGTYPLAGHFEAGHAHQMVCAPVPSSG